MCDEFALVYFKEDCKTSVLKLSDLPIPTSQAFVGAPAFSYKWGNIKKPFTATIKALSSKFSNNVCCVCLRQDKCRSVLIISFLLYRLGTIVAILFVRVDKGFQIESVMVWNRMAKVSHSTM